MKIAKYKVAIAYYYYMWTNIFFCSWLTGLDLKDYFVLKDIMFTL